MVLFKKIRPRRGSLAVSIIWGSPIAASSRSAALAYRIGSPRHDSRYSAIDMSGSLLASKDRAKALNRESLPMIPLLMRQTPGTRAKVGRATEEIVRLPESVRIARHQLVSDLLLGRGRAKIPGWLSYGP